MDIDKFSMLCLFAILQALLLKYYYRLRELYERCILIVPVATAMSSARLELALRADVCPCRGDKKKRRVWELSLT